MNNIGEQLTLADHWLMPRVGQIFNVVTRVVPYGPISTTKGKLARSDFGVYSFGDTEIDLRQVDPADIDIDGDQLRINFGDRVTLVIES